MGTTRKSAGKTRGKPFEPGNPGKPKGTRHKVTRAVEELLDGQAEALTQKAVEMALGGSMEAMRVCMDRICPPRKDRPVMIDLPPVESAEQVSAGLARIIAAAASGELTPTEAQSFAALLEGQRRTLELAELDRRMTELEAERSRG